MDAGHYIHQKSKTFFNEDNLRPQCTRCNYFGKGMQSIYAERLIKQIGLKRVESLRKESVKIKKWTKEELKLLSNEFKLKYEGLFS